MLILLSEKQREMLFVHSKVKYKLYTHSSKTISFLKNLNFFKKLVRHSYFLSVYILYKQ